MKSTALVMIAGILLSATAPMTAFAFEKRREIRAPVSQYKTSYCVTKISSFRRIGDLNVQISSGLDCQDSAFRGLGREEVSSSGSLKVERNAE